MLFTCRAGGVLNTNRKNLKIFIIESFCVLLDRFFPPSCKSTNNRMKIGFIFNSGDEIFFFLYTLVEFAFYVCAKTNGRESIAVLRLRFNSSLKVNIIEFRLYVFFFRGVVAVAQVNIVLNVASSKRKHPPLKAFRELKSKILYVCRCLHNQTICYTVHIYLGWRCVYCLLFHK